MSGPLTIYDVLGAIDARAQKSGQQFVTRVETATELGVSRIEVDPVFDEAVELGYLAEDPKYKDYWALSDEGQTRLDELIFSPGPRSGQAPDVPGGGDPSEPSDDEEPETGTGQTE
jgi:hypothetical protein